MPTFHGVTLDEAQRLPLEKTVGSGTASARTMTRACTVLKADTGEFGPGWIAAEIADALDVGLSTVERTRTRAFLEGIEAAVMDRPRPRRAARSMVRPRHGSSHSAARLRRMVELAGRSTCSLRGSRHSILLDMLYRVDRSIFGALRRRLYSSCVRRARWPSVG